MECNQNTWPWFAGFTESTPALPQLYFDVQTSEQRWKEICVWLKKLTEFSNSEAEKTADNSEAISELEKLLDAVKDGAYADLYLDAIKQYIDANMISFVARIAQYAFPELIYDGETWRYSVVIPKTWSGLAFRFRWDESDNTVKLHLEY